MVKKKITKKFKYPKYLKGIRERGIYYRGYYLGSVRGFKSGYKDAKRIFVRKRKTKK